MNEAVNMRGEKMVVLTEAEFNALVEDAGDNALAEQAIEDSAGAPVMPSELVVAMLEGTLHPLAAWRRSAGLTQAALAHQANVRTATVCGIENGKIDPRVSTLKALADVLGLDLDDLVA